MQTDLIVIQPLKSRKSISNLFVAGGAIKAYPIIGRYQMNTLTGDYCIHIELGVSVPKRRWKRAVDRNRIKRQMREAFRQSMRDRHLLDQSVYLKLMLIYVASDQKDFAEIAASVEAIVDQVVVSN